MKKYQIEASSLKKEKENKFNKKQLSKKLVKKINFNLRHLFATHTENQQLKQLKRKS
jgi:hypothetical protein